MVYKVVLLAEENTWDKTYTGEKDLFKLFRILSKAQLCLLCHAASLTDQWCRYKEFLSAYFILKVE